MKKLLIITLLSGSLFSKAQFLDSNFIFISNEFLVGEGYRFVSAGINYEMDHKYSMEINYSASIIGSREKLYINQPYIYFDLSPVFPPGGPYDQNYSINMMVGKIVKPPSQQVFRFNFMLGIGYSKIINLVNWREESGSGFFNFRYYQYDKQQFTTLSFLIKPKIELTLGRCLGINLFSQCVINKDRVDLGLLGFAFTYGIIREKKIKKPKR